MNDIEELSPEEEKLYSLSDEELLKLREEEHNTEQSEEEVEEESSDLDEDTDDTPDDAADEDSEELDDESTDEPEEVKEDEESDETDEDNSEEDETSDGEDETKESKPDEESDTTKVKPVRANGIDIPVKSLDEVYQMASMGANYKKKMADLAPHRRNVDMMVEHGLTTEDLSLLVDLKKGDKGAISKLLKDSNIDNDALVELDVDNTEYTPKNYAPSEFDLEIKEIVSEIASDPEYSMTKRIVDVEWDDKSREAIKQNPAIVKYLHEDVKNGTYAKVLPEAMRLEMLDVSRGKKPLSKLEYSIIATKAYRDQETKRLEAEQTKATEKKQRVSKKKKAAAPTRSRATKEVTQEKDAFDMTEEEYDAWYQEKLRQI